MLTVEVFQERVKALYRSQQGMVRAKKWKSGKRAGNIRRPAQPIHFNERELGVWLWRKVGLNAITCPHCNAPIDILSLTLDHVIPRDADGETSLDNLEPVCQDCQQRKGPMTGGAYTSLLRFAQSELSPYDQKILLSRLKAAHHGTGRRFFRDKTAESKPQPLAPPAKTPWIKLSGLGDF
jgi:5-methylcytosine-specific restriction endonuclease McrA